MDKRVVMNNIKGDKMRTITLYSNRKYYDKGLRGHINLIDILQAVKDGDEFIIKNKMGQDITTKTVNAAIYKYVTIPMDTCRGLVQGLYEIETVKQTLPTENMYDRL